MRILMVAPRCYPFLGGIETHIHEVGPRLVACGHAVDVLTTDPSGTLLVEERVRGMRVMRVPAWPKKMDLYVAPAVYGVIRRGNWDVIHFQGYNSFVVPIGLAAAIRSDVPFVLTFHSGGHSSRLRNAVRPTQHALLRPLVARAARLIGVSNSRPTSSAPGCACHGSGLSSSQTAEGCRLRAPALRSSPT